LRGLDCPLPACGCDIQGGGYVDWLQYHVCSRGNLVSEGIRSVAATGGNRWVVGKRTIEPSAASEDWEDTMLMQRCGHGGKWDTSPPGVLRV
jgi:hypothetical protein